MPIFRRWAMLDFSSIQNKLISQLPAKSALGNDLAKPGDFQALLLNTQVRMLSAWAEGDTEAADESFAMIPDRFQMLGMLSRFRPENTESVPDPRLNVQAIRQYQMESARFLPSVESASTPTPPRVDSAVPDIQGLVQQSADRYGIPQGFFARLIETESAYDPLAVSPKGAMGLGQLMPGTARELGLAFSGEPGEGSVWDPASNLDASARYLRKLYDMYRSKGIDENESWSFAAGAYNAGMGNIGKAMAHLEGGDQARWDSVAAALYRVTGSASQETVRYVDRLRA